MHLHIHNITYTFIYTISQKFEIEKKVLLRNKFHVTINYMNI